MVAIVALVLASYFFDELKTLFEILSPATNPVLGAALVLWVGVSLFYYTLFDGIFGATPGKATFGLRLRVEHTGRLPGAELALQRTLAGTLDLLLLTAFILPLLNPSGRTLGDYISGTVVLRRTPARQRTGERDRGLSEADRRRFEVGKQAEERVAGTLRSLEAHGYTVFTNIVHPSFGDIDALAIGPGGVFCVEVKGHSGIVTQEPFSGTLLRNGAPFKRDFRKQVHRQVTFLTGYLFKGKRNPPVFAVICFTRASVTANPRGEYPGGVMTLPELGPAIRSAPPLLSLRRIEKVSARIAKLKAQDAPSTRNRRGAA